MFIGILGFLGIFIFAIMAIISLIKKNGKAKRNFIITGVCFVLFVVGVGTSDSSASDDEKANDSDSESVEVSSEQDQEKADEDKDDKAKEAEEKKKDEKAKKDAEEKAKKEAENKEQEKIKKENKEKEKYAIMYDNLVDALSDGNVQISDKSYEFIIDNNKLFPAKDKKDIKKAKEITDDEIGSKHLNKKASPYFDKIVTVSGNVISVEEDDFEDDTLSYIHMMDSDFNSFQIILLKSSDDIFEDDTIRFWGVPVGPNHFENVSGGTTNAQMIVGSHVEKQ